MKLLSIVFGTAIVLAVFASQTAAEPQPDPLFKEAIGLGLNTLQTASQGLWETAQNVANNIKGTFDTVGKGFLGTVQTFKNGVKDLLKGQTKQSA